MTERRLLILDGHSLAYRAYHALPVESFSTKTGQHTNAVYGFTTMLLNVLRDEAPTHVAVTFDVSKKTFRTEAYPEYKAGRVKTPPEFNGQVDLVKEILDALKIPVVTREGYEADDVIATLTTQAEAAGYHVLVSSGDRDSFQLVTENVTVLYPKKGMSDLARMTPDAVQEKYGVPPGKYPDLAALVGEASDNLPGVPGVGPKTAAKWLSVHGNLEGVLAAKDDLPGKAGQALRDHEEQVRRNRRLNALVRDLDLPVAPEDLARRDLDREATGRILEQLEFRVIRERLLEDAAARESPVETEPYTLEARRLHGEEVREWLSVHGNETCGVAVAGTWGRGEGDATGVAVAARGGDAAWVDLVEADPDAERAIREWLADPTKRKVLHDAKGPLHALHARGLGLEGLEDDTALTAYLLQPERKSYDLADLSREHLGKELRAEDGEGGEATDACVQAAATLGLHQTLKSELQRRNGARLLAEMELPLVHALGRMERAGISVDVARLEALKDEFSARAEAAERAAHAAAGRKVNLGSPKQLQTVLFDELKMKKTKKTKTGYTTDADALQELHAQTKHPFLTHLLEHRDAIRLTQTVEGLLRAVSDDGRIRTTFQQTVAATGRLSSTEPNLQNIPIRTREGRRIREAFTTGEGYERIITADYSQIEMRIMAHLSGDEGLKEAFRRGEDLHRYVGARVFQVSPEHVTAEMRAKVKAMSYGLAYGLSAYGLAKQLGISTGEAQRLMDEYFERFGFVRTYLHTVVEEARKTGYTETIHGRRRYLPDLNSSVRQRREIAERMALNAPIQGSAADVIKQAMLNVDTALREEGLKSRLLLQIHDELLVEAAPGETETVTLLLRREMGRAADLDVPLEVSVGSGTTWEEADH